MLRFLCCAFCALLLLASPALGIHIYEDYVIDESNAPTDGTIVVHGDAKLTITGNPNRIRPIHLYDTASLLVEGGWLRGNVSLYGSHEVVFTGGKLDGSARIEGMTDFTTQDIKLLGGEIQGSLYFDKPFAGQDLFIDYGSMLHRVGVYANRNMDITVAGEIPYYRTDGGSAAHVSIGAKDIDFEGGGYGTNILRESEGGPKWLLYSTLDFPSGDSNLDGVVDLTDLNVIRNNFGAVLPKEMAGDTLPYDGVVDLEDLNRVRNNFGSSMQPVPEPATVQLLGLFALAGIPLRHRCCSWLRRFP